MSPKHMRLDYIDLKSIFKWQWPSRIYVDKQEKNPKRNNVEAFATNFKLKMKIFFFVICFCKLKSFSWCVHVIDTCCDAMSFYVYSFFYSSPFALMDWITFAICFQCDVLFVVVLNFYTLLHYARALLYCWSISN